MLKLLTKFKSDLYSQVFAGVVNNYVIKFFEDHDKWSIEIHEINRCKDFISDLNIKTFSLKEVLIAIATVKATANRKVEFFIIDDVWMRRVDNPTVTEPEFLEALSKC